MKWGRWSFDPKNLSLITKVTKGRKLYYIPLAKCNGSVEILDWIAKLHEKKWTSNKDIGDLVEALNDLLDFQTNFSGFGKETFDGNEDYCKRIIERRLRVNNLKDLTHNFNKLRRD